MMFSCLGRRRKQRRWSRRRRKDSRVWTVVENFVNWYCDSYTDVVWGKSLKHSDSVVLVLGITYYHYSSPTCTLQFAYMSSQHIYIQQFLSFPPSQPSLNLPCLYWTGRGSVRLPLSLALCISLTSLHHQFTWPCWLLHCSEDAIFGALTYFYGLAPTGCFL